MRVRVRVWLPRKHASCPRARRLQVFFGDATRPEVLQVFMREAKADISGVVVALDKPSDCTKAVRALQRVSRDARAVLHALAWKATKAAAPDFFTSLLDPRPLPASARSSSELRVFFHEAVGRAVGGPLFDRPLFQ